MKKLTSFILAVLMLLAASVLPALAENPPQGPREDAPARKTGILTLLNTTEEEYTAYKNARQAIYDLLTRDGSVQREVPDRGDDVPDAELPPSPPEGPFPGPNGQEVPAESGKGNPPNGIIFYDSLDSMIMALEAREISSMEVYQNTAKYICANNDSLVMIHPIDLSKERSKHAEIAISTRLSNDFSFLMLESSTALRDEFNTAILAMKEDGTLDQLIREQITDLIEGKEIVPVEMPEFEGVDAITVAVTGDLPPMDYVAADGTPAGFNTAVLAEISRRIGKPIKLIVVSSPARAVALASGRADVIFWTRACTVSDALSMMSEEERSAWKAESEEGLSENDAALVESIEAMAPAASIGNQDMPQGTVITEPYYTDVLVSVELSQGSSQAAE